MPSRFRNSLRPIKSDKHEITWSNLAQDASATTNIALATAVASADKNTATEVEIGSHIKSIYFEFNVAANTITNPKVLHWKVIGNRAGETITAASTYYQADRSRIIKRGMEMLPKDVGTVFKRIFVVRIPRTWQRMQANMSLTFAYVSTSAEPQNLCGFAIYKEYY